MLHEEEFAFGGLGLTIEQLRALRAIGFLVPELDGLGNWASPLVAALVATARRYRLDQGTQSTSTADRHHHVDSSRSSGHGE